MDYWKKQNIDNFIVELEKYYIDSSAEYCVGQGIVDKLNKEEVEYLNENLNLSKIVGVERNDILNCLLKDKEKNKFTELLLKSTNINLDVNNISNSNKSTFILLTENYFKESSYLIKWLIKNLFERGYTIKKQDEIFITELYKGLQSQDQFENWTILRFAVKLNNKEQIRLAFDKLHILFVILSLKLNKPIHFSFPNLLGVLNNAFNSNNYKENGDVILKAIEVYSRKTTIQELDSRKGNFKKKLSDYEQNKPIQNKEFEEIIKIVFPELK